MSGFDPHYPANFPAHRWFPRMVVIGTIFAPVKPGMGIEYGETAHQKYDKTQGIAPVPYPGGHAMARLGGYEGVLRHRYPLPAGSALPSLSLQLPAVAYRQHTSDKSGPEQF